MPKVWKETIAEHRQAVRDATIETTAALVADRGLRSVTMSQIAEEAGIGRATLYKYFADVESILHAWHERQITRHLDRLAEVRDRANGEDRLAAVLETYALIAHESLGHPDSELAALLHRDDQVTRAEHHLLSMISDLIKQAAKAGTVRDDVSPTELANYCVRALTASRTLPSRAAIRRLVEVTLDGLRSKR